MTLIAAGLIIAATIVVAAGIAIYESPHVRAWVDQSRRKLAVALHTLGDEVEPRPGHKSRAGKRQSPAKRGTSSGGRQNADLLGLNDFEGSAKQESRRTQGNSTATDQAAQVVRHRRGIPTDSPVDSSQDLTDSVLLKPGVNELSDNLSQGCQLASSSTDSHSSLKSPARDAEAPGPTASDPLLPCPAPGSGHASEGNRSTGTLTPRSSRLSSSASVIDSQAAWSMQSEDGPDHDTRSDAFSEGGFSEVCAPTPSEWSDIASDTGSE